MFPSVAARLRVLATLLFLSSCGSDSPTVVLDLLSVLPAAEKRMEPGRIDFGGPSEELARLEGFSESSRGADGTTFRRVGSARATLGVWLMRPSAWTVLLRYRTSASHLPGRIQSGGQRVMELPP